jgi:hypothetical protein
LLLRIYLFAKPVRLFEAVTNFVVKVNFLFKVTLVVFHYLPGKLGLGVLNLGVMLGGIDLSV